VGQNLTGISTGSDDLGAGRQKPAKVRSGGFVHPVASGQGRPDNLGDYFNHYLVFFMDHGNIRLPVTLSDHGPDCLGNQAGIKSPVTVFRHHT